MGKSSATYNTIKQKFCNPLCTPYTNVRPEERLTQSSYYLTQSRTKSVVTIWHPGMRRIPGWESAKKGGQQMSCCNLAGKMCWTSFKNIGHSSKNLGPSRKTLRPSWCPKLVTGLMVALLNNATRMRPVQIWVRQTQNLPVTSRHVS